MRASYLLDAAFIQIYEDIFKLRCMKVVQAILDNPTYLEKISVGVALCNDIQGFCHTYLF